MKHLGQKEITINFIRVLYVDMGYIYIPIVIFLFGYCKFYIAVSVSLVVFFMIKRLLHDYSIELKDSKTGYHYVTRWWIWLVVFIVLLVFGLFFGWGAFFPQSRDWSKHNAILRDLIDKSWPVYYTNQSETSMLTYYIGQYLFPALIGKLFSSFAVAEICLLVWNTLGLTLVFFNLIFILRPQNNKQLFGVLWQMLFFCGALLLAQIVARAFYGDAIQWAELSKLAKTQWFRGETFKLQYKSAFTSIRWTFHQWIVPALTATIFYRFRNQLKHYVSLILPMLLYASFSFLGMVMLALGYALYGFVVKRNKAEVIRQIFSLENILSCMSLGVVLLIYFYGNVFGPKPPSIAFMCTDYGELWGCYFIFCFFMFGVHALLIWKQYKKDVLFYGVIFTLCILPLFTMGYYNDLVLNGGTVALFLLMVYILDFLINGDKKIKLVKSMLILLLLIGNMYPLIELSEVIKTNTLEQQRKDTWGTLEIKANRQDDSIRDDYKYNYYAYDLENNIFYNYIARRK